MYEEVRKFNEFMDEFETIELELPNRVIYAFKRLTQELYGNEREIELLFIVMLQNTADKYSSTIPKLASERYYFMQREKQIEEENK